MNRVNPYSDEEEGDDLAALIEQLMSGQQNPSIWELAAPSGLTPPTGDLGAYLQRLLRSSSHPKTRR